MPVSFTVVSGPGTLTGGVLTVTGAGSIVIQADQPGDASHNAATPVPQTLVVTPAPLTVTANDASRFVEQPNPAFTATFAGLVNGDTPAALSGALAFSTPAGAGSPPGAYPITPSGLSSANYTITFAAGTLTVNPVVGLVAVGAGPGGGPAVKVFNPDGTLRFSFLAYEPAFTGGVSVATADVTGDGVDDIITGAGAGGSSRVEVFDGATGGLVQSFFAYDPSARFGVSVGAADLDGDGKAEILTGAGVGGAPRVEVFRASDLAVLRSFYAFDPGLRGGVTVAGLPGEIVAGSGPGAGSQVNVFRFTDLGVAASFAPFGGFTGGVDVGAGNGQIVVGAGPGGTPQVNVYTPGGTGLASFAAFAPSFAGGVHVDVSDGPTPLIVVGAGPGGGPAVAEYTPNFSPAGSFFAFDPGFAGGVFVG
jgi:hypothetical protein